MPSGRREWLTLTAVGCLAVALWLLVVAVLYVDWLGLAVGLTSVIFGVAHLRDRRAREMRGGEGHGVGHLQASKRLANGE